MNSIPNSGLFYPANFSQMTLKAFEEIIGKGGLSSILSNTELTHMNDILIFKDLENKFDFSYYSRINSAIEQMYLPQTGFGLSIRCGRAIFAEVVRQFGDIAGVNHISFRLLPLSQKITIGLSSLSEIISSISKHKIILEETNTDYHFIIQNCPICWNRSEGNEPVCYLIVGFLQEALKWVSGGKDFHVREVECKAMNDPVCRFLIRKTTIH